MISSVTYLKSESNSLQRGLVVLSAIDKNDTSFDIAFLLQFAEKNLGECGHRCRGRPDVEEIVRFGASRDVQPVLLILDPSHCLIKRDLIWTATSPQL